MDNIKQVKQVKEELEKISGIMVAATISAAKLFDNNEVSTLAGQINLARIFSLSDDFENLLKRVIKEDAENDNKVQNN